MIYTFRCSNTDCKDDSGEGTVVEAEASMMDFKEQHPPCTKCGDPCNYFWTPSIIQFALKDGPSGSWPSKGNRFKSFRQKASEAAAVRQKNRYGENHGAVPNYGGNETENWREAQSHAIKEHGFEIAASYTPKIAEETLKKK